MADSLSRIAENLADVRSRIAQAAARSGRTERAVRLIAVTKYVDVRCARMLLEVGCQDLGESRPQELWSKAAALPPYTRWHMIGHLQRNKVRRTLPLVTLFHSADSLRLLHALDEEAAIAQRSVDVLLEVNVSGERNKHGFAPTEMAAVLDEATSLSHIKVHGLMAMAGLEGTLEDARREFANLRELRNGLRRNAPESMVLHELSMGMSEDFEIAIEEGATMVRVGSVLFEGVQTAQ